MKYLYYYNPKLEKDENGMYNLSIYLRRVDGTVSTRVVSLSSYSYKELLTRANKLVKDYYDRSKESIVVKFIDKLKRIF